MRTKIILVALCALFFSAFHDSLMPILQKQEQLSIVCQGDTVTSCDTKECHKCSPVHSLLHFIAIIVPFEEAGFYFVKQMTIPHLPHAYTSPLEQSSYKPPIA